jgi:hypothetical protein
MGHRLGVDVGGTFTDVQMQDTDTGDVTLVARCAHGVVVSPRGEIDAAVTEQARDGVDHSDEFDFGPVPDKAQLTQRIADERRDFDAWMAAESRA